MTKTGFEFWSLKFICNLVFVVCYFNYFSLRTTSNSFFNLLLYTPYSGFHTFQTLPTNPGPGFNTALPSSQPAGQASAPLVFRTC